MREIASNIKTIKPSHGGANSAPSYNNPLLSAPAIAEHRPSGYGPCHWCVKTHEQAIVLLMEKSAANAEVLIISKPFFIVKAQPKGVANLFKKKQPQPQ